MPEKVEGEYAAVVDALLGFGAAGPLRPPFDAMIRVLAMMGESKTPVISVDVPSGWDLEEGDVHGMIIDRRLPSWQPAQRVLEPIHYCCTSVAWTLCLCPPDAGTGFRPAALVSLTAPKRCARFYQVGSVVVIKSARPQCHGQSGY
jgi:NAD(P)H-hydrate repair Nnr-like enzyme with NAD(P)H-hydrate epimerase domain